MLAKKIKVKVEALDKLNEEVSHKKGCGPGSASERTRTSVTAGMKKKLKELMDEFSSLRNKIHDEYREVVERRVYTVTGKHMAEDDIDKMIESGESEHIFQKAIMEQGRGRVLDTLAEIQERHKAVQVRETRGRGGCAGCAHTRMAAAAAALACQARERSVGSLAAAVARPASPVAQQLQQPRCCARQPHQHSLARPVPQPAHASLVSWISLSPAASAPPANMDTQHPSTTQLPLR